MIDDMQSPLVTAIITTYDRPMYLEAAVKSVLDQTYDNLELIVVDDHSPVPAADVLSNVDVDALERTEIIRHDENRGANAARNTGIGAASGEYVVFLDDDDRWVPKKTARQLREFQRSDDVGVVYAGVWRSVGDDTKVQIPPHIEESMTKTLLCENVVGSMSVVMVRTDVAKSVPLDEEFPCWADLEWYINLSRETSFQCVPEPLVRYETDSPGRLSRDFEKTHRGYELFLNRFDPLAAEFGPEFQRKMRGWAAFRAGKGAFHDGRYARARAFFGRAVLAYPLESEFWQFLFASAGGPLTHSLGRTVAPLAGK
ncbi:MAG: glycosyltransferase family 2 protein [Haloarcula sp.]